jgi:hypothetical protein
MFLGKGLLSQNEINRPDDEVKTLKKHCIIPLTIEIKKNIT